MSVKNIWKQAFDRVTFPLHSWETSFQKLARMNGWVIMRHLWKQAFDRTTFPMNSDRIWNKLSTKKHTLKLVIGYKNRIGRINKILVNFWTSLLKKQSLFKINAPLFRNVSRNKLHVIENMPCKACILNYSFMCVHIDYSCVAHNVYVCTISWKNSQCSKFLLPQLMRRTFVFK